MSISKADAVASYLHLQVVSLSSGMFLKQPQAPLSVTLLAGRNRALRALVLEQLMAKAEACSQDLTVLSFDRQRRRLTANSTVRFRWANNKSIRISQPGLVVPFRADIFLELNAIIREHLPDEVVVELTDNAELPGVCDTLMRHFPGGIDLRKIARLKRSITIMEAAGLADDFWTREVASETEVSSGPDSEDAYSHAHTLARSIECSDTVVLSDAITVAPESLGTAIRLLRAVNPGATIVDTRLFRFDSIPVAGSVDEDLRDAETDISPSHLRARWVVSDDDFARLELQTSRPLHPQRFYEFVQGGWRGVLRGRGQVRIASQPGAYRLWSQAGQVGVVGSKASDRSPEWTQNMTFVGPREACMTACRHLEASLLTDEEIELGVRLWRAFIDPLRE